MKPNRKAITHEEVQRALQAFQRRGGAIRQLPDQVTPQRNLMGAKWAIYELLPVAQELLEGRAGISV